MSVAWVTTCAVTVLRRDLETQVGVPPGKGICTGPSRTQRVWMDGKEQERYSGQGFAGGLVKG